MADAGADSEGEPRRPVPRLAYDPALIDQVRVVVADLVLADPPDEILHAAAADLTATLAALTR